MNTKKDNRMAVILLMERDSKVAEATSWFFRLAAEIPGGGARGKVLITVFREARSTEQGAGRAEDLRRR